METIKVIVRGNTYEYRQAIREDGGNWDAENRYWYFLCGNRQAAVSALRHWNDRANLGTWAYEAK